MIRPVRAPDSHEDVFVARYTRLLAWARQIVAGDRDAAEDLVHDAFVNISVSRPDLAGMSNVDGYLYTTLRNLHLANVRRGARRGVTPLPLVEYESAAKALQALVPTRAHDELAAICHYACLRRTSSKAGSVLILRFFHGYRRAEVASVLRLSPEAVDNLLSIARREAHIWLHEPNRLRFMHRTEGAPRTIGLVDSAHVLRDLQAAIYKANETACLQEAGLRASYASSSPPLDCGALAHMVACQRCLDIVNDALDLPRLADRHADDGIDSRKRPPSDPGAARSGGAGAGRAAVERHVQEVLRSQPAELRIAVNGQVLGGQHVSSARVSQHLLVQSAERLGFVEVLDEHDERLFLMNVEPPPDGAAEQHANVQLSDDRELALSVSFAGAWPSITLFYASATSSAGATEAQTSAGDKPLAPASAWGRLRAWLRILPRLTPSPVVVVVAVLVLIVALAGPRQAWSAVAEFGRTLVQWVNDLVTDPSTSQSDRGEGTRRHARSRDIELTAPVMVSVPAPAPVPRGLSEAALLGLEVEILQRLDGAGALYGEDLSLTRPRNGYLSLAGMVDGRHRRSELIAALGALVHVPQLEVRLRLPEAPSASIPSVHVFEVERDRNAVSGVLTQALTANGLTASPEMTRSLAVRVLNNSDRSLRHAWAFTRLARQVDGDRLRAVHPDAYRTWHGLLNEHVRGFADRSRDIHAALTSIGLASQLESNKADREPHLEGDGPVRNAERLVRLAEEQDRAVRALFAVAPGGAPTDVRRALDDLTAQLHASAVFAGRLLDR